MRREEEQGAATTTRKPAKGGGISVYCDGTQRQGRAVCGRRGGVVGRPQGRRGRQRRDRSGNGGGGGGGSLNLVGEFGDGMAFSSHDIGGAFGRKLATARCLHIATGQTLPRAALTVADDLNSVLHSNGDGALGHSADRVACWSGCTSRTAGWSP